MDFGREKSGSFRKIGLQTKPCACDTCDCLIMKLSNDSNTLNEKLDFLNLTSKNKLTGCKLFRNLGLQ
jgi:hypothetical protein